MTQLDRGTDHRALWVRRLTGIALLVSPVGLWGGVVGVVLAIAFLAGFVAAFFWLFLRSKRSPLVPDLEAAVALGDLELAERLLDRCEPPTRALLDQAIARKDQAMARLLVSAWQDPDARKALAAALPSRDA